MTDLPYTYTELDGDSLRMCSDGPDLVVTVRQDGGARTVVVPREETPNLARAVLAAAGDTGHEVIARATYTLRVQQAFQDGARSMRERVLAGVVDLLETHGTTDDLLNDVARLRALPLLPDDDGNEQASPGSEVRDLRSTLAQRERELKQVGEARHQAERERDRLRTAWTSARRRARQQRDALRDAMIAETDRARRARDRYRDERNTAREQLADARRYVRILEEQRKDLRKKLSAETDRVAALRIAYQAAKDAGLPEEDMVEPGDEVPALDRRVTDLEQQFTDLAALVHGHGEDLARIRYRFTEEDDG